MLLQARQIQLPVTDLQEVSPCRAEMLSVSYRYAIKAGVEQALENHCHI